jgi:hypothetical protein
MSDSPKYTDEELDNVANLLNEAIITLPVDGFFKIRINNPVSPQGKVEITAMLEDLAKKLSRPDITVIIEGIGDLN